MTDFRLRGLFSVLPTIFHDDGSLDAHGTAAVVEATLAAGATGLTVLGVMGEAAELEEDERRAVLATVVRATAGRPVVLGVTGEAAALVSDRARAAADAGASAVMVSPTRALPLAAAVAAAATGGLPIVVQDYPPASGVTVRVEELAALDEPHLVGVKAESPPTSSAIAELRRRRPDLDAMGGLGGLLLIDELRAGASGTMTGFALPERLVAIVERFPGDPDGSARDWEALLPLMRLEAFAPFSLAARKEVWRLRGVIASARCRRPGTGLDDVARRDVRRALDSVGVAAVAGS